MTYKLVIFDFDGTLADSLGWMKGVIDGVARRFRFRAPAPDEIEGLRHLEANVILARLGIARWKVPFIAMDIRRLAARDAAQIPLFPGALDLLAQLEARGVVIAIVSSNSESNVRRILGPAAAARVRYYGCSASLFGKRKKLRGVLSRAGVAPRDAIAIGDEVRDIDAASAEGIDTGAVTWGYGATEILRAHRPTSVFTTLDDLLNGVAPPA